MVWGAFRRSEGVHSGKWGFFTLRAEPTSCPAPRFLGHRLLPVHRAIQYQTVQAFRTTFYYIVSIYLGFLSLIPQCIVYQESVTRPHHTLGSEI